MNRFFSRVLKNHWLFPFTTLLVQFTGVIAMRWQILTLLNPHAELSADKVLHTSYTMLGTFGALGTVTALGGIYQLLRWARWQTAIPLLAFACLPSLFLSMCYLYGLMLFGGLI